MSTGWALDLAAEAPGRSVWDWVGLDLTARQLLEVENDLIAGHMVEFRTPPRAQFGHSSRVAPDIGAPSG